ncbi:hypothetical protein H2203_008928 [Taxawa tesnikishii (nom. ined.)]|nr:hypothetical protein H2203_008928 [Dothideales sp. JES 119]
MAPKNKKTGKPTKTAPPASRATVAEPVEETLESNESSTKLLPLQQTLLNIFKDACAGKLGPDLEETLQEVKKHLYNRDFLAAFGKNEYLQAYAARWSPSRALGYLQVFSDLSAIMFEAVQPRLDARAAPQNNDISSSRGELTEEGLGSLSIYETSNSPTAEDNSAADEDQLPAYEDQESIDRKPPPYSGQASPYTASYENGKLQIACLGGGAGAEIVALAGWLSLLRNDNNGSDPSPVTCSALDVRCFDIAHWDRVVEDLHQRITTPAVLSKYASAAAKAANIALLPVEAINIGFQQKDVLDIQPNEMNEILRKTNIVTLMFTLNELYSTSMSKTQRFLYQITSSLRPGSLLLVVDSPGSYSAVTINGTEKKYPMQWLLDYTLLQTPTKTGTLPPGKHWEKLVSDESRWFRLPKGLKYPIELENMRYQIHLYKRYEPDT